MSEKGTEAGKEREKENVKDRLLLQPLLAMVHKVTISSFVLDIYKAIKIIDSLK